MHYVIEATNTRFDALPAAGDWTDEQGMEADYLLKVRISTGALLYEKERLLFALRTLADATDTGDTEAIRRAMLWARHYLDRIKTD